MKGRDRALVGALVVGSMVTVIGLVAAASQLCPGPTATDACPDADRNRLIVLGLAGLVVALVVTPGAFLVEFAARRRIVYRGAWARAARRGALAGMALAAVAGLRLAEALTAFSAGVVLVLVAIAEWLAIRRLDAG